MQVDKTLIRKIDQNRNSIVNFRECYQLFAFHLDANKIYSRLTSEIGTIVHNIFICCKTPSVKNIIKQSDLCAYCVVRFTNDL